jgi:hypothetical protein
MGPQGDLEETGMIGYTMIGTNDLEKSLRFYDPLMAAMDLDQCWRDEQSVSGASARMSPFRDSSSAILLTAGLQRWAMAV